MMPDCCSKTAISIKTTYRCHHPNGNFMVAFGREDHAEAYREMMLEYFNIAVTVHRTESSND